MGACSDEPRRRLADNLACAIWPEDEMSPLGAFTLTSRLKRSSHHEYAVHSLGQVAGGSGVVAGVQYKSMGTRKGHQWKGAATFQYSENSADYLF